MSSTLVYRPIPRTIPEAPNTGIKLDDPLTLPEVSKTNIIQRIMPIVMALMMLGMFMLIILTGMRVMSPMMMMAPAGMLISGLAYMGLGGSSGAQNDLYQPRKKYFRHLDQQRILAHQLGAYQHLLQASAYPDPNTLLSKVGVSMWRVNRRTGSAPKLDSAEADRTDAPPMGMYPYLSARVGVARATELTPKIRPGTLVVEEDQEPLTTGAWRRFLRTQNFVTKCPLGVDLAALNAFAFHTDEDAKDLVLGLGRAMMMSLAYNHLPTEVAIGIVTQNPAEWDWVKWLPHTQDTGRHDLSGTARNVWGSLAEYAASPALPATEDGNPTHTVVFIDTPNVDAILPPGINKPNTTFVVLRAISDSLTAPDAWLRISANRDLRVPYKNEPIAKIDTVTYDTARVFAMRMAQFRPKNWDADVVEEASDKELSFLEVNGVNGRLEDYDPRPQWEKNSADSHFNIPLGYTADLTSGERDGQITWLDMAEASIEGAGHHGTLQGLTGAGKSVLLGGLVLSLALRYGPDKVNFILMDFKGGLTFNGFEKLPHVIAHITNLEEEIELIDRAGDVIEGEIIRREEELRALKLESYVEWREKCAEDPTFPKPPPSIFIIVDEFHEFMHAHKDKGYQRLLTRGGAVGRAIDMRILASSQFIDEVLIGDLMKHTTYGISLKAASESYSRTVLKKTGAAVNLPSGQGAGILYRGTGYGQELERFWAFNVKERYLSAEDDNTTTVSGRSNRSRGRAGLHQFTLTNQFHQNTPTPNDPTANTSRPRPADPKRGVPLREAIPKQLAKFNEITALDLWKPSLRAPITYADIPLEETYFTAGPVQIRIGDIDAPKLAKRLPYILKCDGAGSNTRILGKTNTGRTTAMQSIVMGAAHTYHPRYCNFYLIDYMGAKLSEVANLPNVGGYARKNDTDKIDRFIGEFMRVLAIREGEFGDRQVTDLAGYFQSRETAPVAEDPYGHMFLMIDGFAAFAEYYKESGVIEQLLKIMRDGSSYGLHLIVSADSDSKIPMKLKEHFGNTIHLMVEEINSSTTLDTAMKNLLRQVPKDQTGRCIDLESGLNARIVVPQREPIAATGHEKGNDTFNHYENHGARIRALTDMLATKWEPDPNAPAPLGDQRAPRIEPAPPVIDYQVIDEVYGRYVSELRRKQPLPIGNRRKSLDIRMPIGISCEDLRVVEIPDEISPHLLALGDVQSGKTSLLRGLINSIRGQYTNEEAKILIIESRYNLLVEQEELKNQGYLLSYVDSMAALEPAMRKLEALMEPRFPAMDDGEVTLSAQIMRDRSWFQGPEIFVIIDGVATFSGTYGVPSPLDYLVSIIERRNDLGMHVYATGLAKGFVGQRESNKLYKAFSAASTPTLLFSGPSSDGTIWPSTGIKFAKRRAGQAALVEANSSTAEIIQTPLARPWDEDVAAE